MSAETLQSCRIGFIGAGNMAGSLIRGLRAKGVAAEQLWATDLDQDKLTQLRAECGIHITTASDIARHADVLVLAVKPQSMEQACSGIAGAIAPASLVVSIAAGITVQQLQNWLGRDVALVRCMPNTPALVGRGATGLYAAPSVSAEQKARADAILAAVGIVVWLDKEASLDAVTAVSGSGPAYFFLLMECMQNAAVNLGLDSDSARLLVYQTALGAAELALASPLDTAQLRRQVTSPGGTTEQAILRFENGGLRNLVDTALAAAERRSRELANGN